MWAHYKYQQTHQPDAPFSQLFITCNRVLKDQVERSFQSLLTGDTKPNDHCAPRFFNSTDWLLLLDRDLAGDAFFDAKDISASWT